MRQMRVGAMLVLIAASLSGGATLGADREKDRTAAAASGTNAGSSRVSGRPVPAFPGAEGAGAFATGGRGGTVVHVTNLNADGPGSLADAVSQPNRIVVFDVSGAIDLLAAKKHDGDVKAKKEEIIKELGGRKESDPKSAELDKKVLDKKIQWTDDYARNRVENPDLITTVTGRTLSIKQPNITIAGQTAPGEGVALIHGGLAICAENVIVRHIRVRRGHITPSDMGDGITAKGDSDRPLRNVIIDHCSSCWCTDETITMTGDITDGTVQYCIASEGLDYFNPPQTPPKHSEGSLMGSSLRGGGVSFHHIIYAHNRLRNPRLTGAGEEINPVLDVRNCVIYNGKEAMAMTGSDTARGNLINNYFKYGVDSQEWLPGVIFTFHNKKGPFYLYASGNVADGYPDVTRDNWLGMRYQSNSTIRDKGGQDARKAGAPFPMAPIATQTAQEAYETCLAESGATLPSRDWIDHRIVTDVRADSGRIIDKETDLPEKFRWCSYLSLPAPADTDRDGMPDYWEAQYGLDKNKDDSAGDLDEDVYTNIEEYLNDTDPTGGDKPIVCIRATVSRADGYDQIPGELQVTRAGKTDKELAVRYSVGGTAKAGDDYEALSGEVRIPAGKSSAKIPVMPVKQPIKLESEQRRLLFKGDRSVAATLESGPGYNMGCPRAALVVIKPF